MSFSEAELEEQLKEVGAKLLNPPSTPDELLYLLDRTEHLLINVEQAPSRTMQDALLSPMKALISPFLLKNSYPKVKMAVASCLTEITRITAPDAPYNDEYMKEIFQLVLDAFCTLSRVTNHDYGKAVSILDTVAKVRSCLVMLDLELEDLVLQMFHLFLRVISYDHPPNVYVSMETIMTLVIAEIEEVSVDLLLVLLSSVKKSVQDQSTRAWMLGTKVMTNCAAKIKPCLQEAVQFEIVKLEEYGLIVRSICQDDCNGSGYSTDVENNEEQKQMTDGKLLKNEAETAKKRGRKPNSLRNPVEGYANPWNSSEQKKPTDAMNSEIKGRNPVKKTQTKRKEGEVGDSGDVSDDATLKASKKQSAKHTKPDKTHDHHDSSQTPKGVKRSNEVSKKQKVKNAAAEMAELGEKLIGRRIKVWWPMDKTFYEGIVDSYDRSKRKHMVLYTDGDQEVLNLRKQRWELVGDLSFLKESEENLASIKKRKMGESGGKSAVKVGGRKTDKDESDGRYVSLESSRRESGAFEVKGPDSLPQVQGDDVSARNADK